MVDKHGKATEQDRAMVVGARGVLDSDFEIVHRAGKDNTVPDLLSWKPNGPIGDTPGALGVAFMWQEGP